MSLVGLLRGLLVAITFISLPTTAAQAATSASQQGRKISLRDQLNLGLKVRTKGEKAFIDKVVVLVEQRKLPRVLVDGTFLWARERAVRHSRSRGRRPMVYFQPGLIQRARRFGIKL